MNAKPVDAESRGRLDGPGAGVAPRGRVAGAAVLLDPQQGLADRARRDRACYVELERKGYLRATPGATVDYDLVAGELLEITGDFSMQAIALTASASTC